MVTSMVACSKEVKVDLDIPDADQYGRLYIPQANHNPILKQISLTDEVYQLDLSAFYGGPNKADKQISVSFTIDEEALERFNQQNGTSYQMLPEGSYSFEKTSALIAQGSSTTEVLKIDLMGKGFLEPFVSYILPITMQSDNAPVSESLRTVYYEVVGSYAPGEVPREKVLSLGEFDGGLLFSFKDEKIVSMTPGGTLKVHELTEDDVYSAGYQIGVGFNIFSNLFYFSPNRIVGLNANVTQYRVNDQGHFGASRTIGTGWNIFQHVLPYKQYLLGVRTTGLTTSYPYNEAGDIDGGNIRDIASDWNRYDQIIEYGNSLLAIEPDGTLWQIPMSSVGLPGARLQIGDGWDMYESITVSGTDVLALDSSGDVWRYRFNPKGYWPLKP